MELGPPIKVGGSLSIESRKEVTGGGMVTVRVVLGRAGPARDISSTIAYLDSG